MVHADVSREPTTVMATGPMVVRLPVTPVRIQPTQAPEMVAIVKRTIPVEQTQPVQPPVCVPVAQDITTAMAMQPMVVNQQLPAEPDRVLETRI